MEWLPSSEHELLLMILDEDIKEECGEYDSSEMHALAHVVHAIASQHNQSRNRRRGLYQSPNIDRNFEWGTFRIMNDYFVPGCTYPEHVFKRRFRLCKTRFVQLLEAVEEHNPFFKQKRDAVGKLGASAVQKVTSAVRMLAYGKAADSFDEYCRLSETLILDSLMHFCNSIISLYSNKYLSLPTEEEFKKIERSNNIRGFPGMIGMFIEICKYILVIHI